MMNQGSLKFCMVTTFYPPYSFGGDAIFVYRLSNELAQHGHRVEVVHCVDAYRVLSLGANQPSKDYPNHSNVTVHSLKSKARVLSPLITHQTGHPGLKASRLKEILNNGKFDVIHFHNISLIGPKVLSYGTGIKLYTLHEHWLVCPTHVLWKFNRVACTRKHCFACTIHAKRPIQLWRYTNFLSNMLKNIDAFIAPSLFTRDKHREMGLVVKSPIVHIPHFLYPPVPSNIATDKESPHPRPYFLFVGRLEKLKGIQVLIEAFRSYRECDLLIIGAGTYESHLRHLARGLAHVHFLGYLEYKRLQVLFRYAIAAMVPSIGYEVFPLVILEVFAQQTPVIVHNLGPLPEIVQQSGGGLIYDDESGLLKALEKLRSNIDLRKTLGARGYHAYLKYWTPESHVQQYFDLIERLATEKQVTLGAQEGVSKAME
jgi:glycosyltransferase involved in cell wall biosynthesis